MNIVSRSTLCTILSYMAWFTTVKASDALVPNPNISNGLVHPIIFITKELFSIYCIMYPFLYWFKSDL